MYLFRSIVKMLILITKAIHFTFSCATLRVINRLFKYYITIVASFNLNGCSSVTPLFKRKKNHAVVPGMMFGDQTNSIAKEQRHVDGRDYPPPVLYGR